MRQDHRDQRAERVVDTELDNVDEQPQAGPLPEGSRMTAERSPRFVGRGVELRRVASGLREARTVVLTGADGSGKSQLAIEFAHRFGRHFAGGVFWLSFSMPDEVPAQVAACGGTEAMDLRADFAELTLDEKLHLVQRAWQGE